MIRRVAIEKLAVTGEGVARTRDGVGFVEGGLPEENRSRTARRPRPRRGGSCLESAKRIVAAGLRHYLARERAPFRLAVVDPPRAGLGRELAAALAQRIQRRLVYVSCDPATLARDLPILLAQGWEIAGCRLYDLFAMTHRIESVVTLVRGRAH